MSTKTIEMREGNTSILESKASPVIKTTEVSSISFSSSEEGNEDLAGMLKKASLELKQRNFLDKEDEFVPAYKPGVSYWPVVNGMNVISASKATKPCPVVHASQYYKETFDLALRVFQRNHVNSHAMAKAYSKMGIRQAEEQLFKAVIKMIDFEHPDVPKRWFHEMVKGMWAVFELCGDGMKAENEERIIVTWRGERRIWIVKT